MAESCCICGLILAPDNSDFPQWCKDISALCCHNDEPILSGTGNIDNDVLPFNLPLHLDTFQRFDFRRYLDEIQDCCYPFHTACLTLLRENDSENILDRNVESLFAVFKSIHYHKAARALKWGHNYYLEDILDLSSAANNIYPLVDIIATNKANLVILKDPLPEIFQAEVLDPEPFGPFISSASTRHTRDPGIYSLPDEILMSVMNSLDFRDAMNLLHAGAPLYRRYRGPRDLPSLFWESRFWPHSENGFARSLRPPLYSWKDWFFRVKLELRQGPNSMNLRNRKRIWKLALNLINLMHTLNSKDRILHGNTVTTLQGQTRGYVAGCLARGQYDSEGCRELTQRFVSFSSRARLYAVIPSYTTVWDRSFLSGLRFEFSDGESVNVGYIVKKQKVHTEPTVSPRVLWLVASQLGFEAITVDAYPQNLIDSFRSRNGTRFAIARWTLENLDIAKVGVDAIRIVRVYVDNQKQYSLDGILWTPPYPSSTPTILEEDVIRLCKLQSKCFAPASIHHLYQGKRSLTAIKVYSPLGCGTGITGVGFIDNAGVENIWGSTYDAASLVFFLDSAEQVVKIRVYKIDTLVCSLQFTTSRSRTSNPLPPLFIPSSASLDGVEYKAPKSGYITGFCGCFVDQLHCFGVLPISTAVSFKPSLESLTSGLSLESQFRDMPLSIGSHGKYKAQVQLTEKYRSIQAAINPVGSKYRRAGQVTGLLFRSNNDASHPDLLGQWTTAGSTYYLSEGEQIVDLKPTTVKPLERQIARLALSQVNGITIITNYKKITWNLNTVGLFLEEHVEESHFKRTIIEVCWEFNAIFDRIICIYK